MKTTAAVLLIFLTFQTLFAQTKIEEYGQLYSEDEGSRLAYISQEFLKDENSKIYVLINKKKKMPYGKFLRYFYGIENYLNLFNIPKKSIVTVAGEEKDEQLTQIWVIKDSQKLPAFNKTSVNEGINLDQSKKVLFDENCLDCDTSPFVHQFILKEGVDYLAKALVSNPNSNALLTIARVKNISKSFRERSELTREILTKFKSKGIQRNRVTIRFTSGMNVRFYIVPKITENN